MKNILKVGARVIGILAVIALIALGIALVLGYVYIGAKQPGQVAQNSVAVCDSKDIDAYNKFVTTFTSTDEQRKDKLSKMQDQLTSIKKKNGFADDPTCRFIEYSTAVVAGDVQAAQGALSAIEAASKSGIYPNNNLLDIVSLGSMRDRIEALKGPVEEGPDSRGSG